MPIIIINMFVITYYICDIPEFRSLFISFHESFLYLIKFFTMTVINYNKFIQFFILFILHKIIIKVFLCKH